MSKADISETLKKLLDGVKNRAKFARDYAVPGGPDMMYQHMNGLRPVSLEAAIAYCKGFTRTLEEISPSWAERIDAIPRKTPRNGSMAHQDFDKYNANVKVFEKKTNPDIEAVVNIMETTDEKGRGMVLAAVKFALMDYKPEKTNSV